MVDRVETWVEHPVLGDLQVDTTYANYQDFGGLKVPTKIVQKRAGLQTFEATITSGTANPANLTQLLTPPPPAGGAPAAAGAGRGGAPGAPAAAPAVASEKMADGVYRITGGYVALAVEFKDHVVVLEGGQNEARGIAVIAETKRVIPNKPIKYVVNTHAHFDHASGLAPFAAEGITIITHENNKAYLEKALSGPRTLVGDNLAKSNKKPKVESAGDKRVLKDETHTIELHHIKDLAAQRRHARRVLAQGKDPVHGGLQHPGAGSAASSGDRDARPERRTAEARFRRTRAGARAEPGSPDDQGRSDGAGQGDAVRAR